MIQQHNIPPLYDSASRVLLLGSFPSVKSREGQFFYHHPQNRFWRVLSGVLGCETPATVEEKSAMLHAHHIALWDVIASCEITGSSDSSIRSVVPNDVGLILAAAPIRAIFCTGGTAHRCYRSYLEPTLGRSAILLPSTSPANAAWSENRLTSAWRELLSPYL